MCVRYYVDDDTAREREKLVRQGDEKRKRKTAPCKVEVTAKDIHPTETAPILHRRQTLPWSRFMTACP